MELIRKYCPTNVLSIQVDLLDEKVKGDVFIVDESDFILNKLAVIIKPYNTAGHYYYKLYGLPYIAQS